MTLVHSKLPSGQSTIPDLRLDRLRAKLPPNDTITTKDPAMYLLPIHVPIYKTGADTLVSSEWARALELLRDSLKGRFGRIGVVAPTMPAATAEQNLSRPPEDIDLYPGFDLRCRARQYWLQHRPAWIGQLNALVERADVVHGGMDDVFRPIGFEGFRAGVRLNKPTIFVQDTDIVTQQRQLAATAGAKRRIKAQVYAGIYERMCRWSVAHADLSLLKGSSLIERYGRFARNAKEFHDTSFSALDIVPAAALDARVAQLGTRPLRLVFCGRLVKLKGLQHSLQLVAAAKLRGARVTFDIIGDGVERPALEHLVAELRLADDVNFLGALNYDSALLRRLADYDGLLYTPVAEDTPRMIFDGYAAGLPLVAFDIGYVREREREEHATVMLPRDDVEKARVAFEALCRDPAPLAQLARRARDAAATHSSESWYERRADWTFEAVARHARSGAATITA